MFGFTATGSRTCVLLVNKLLFSVSDTHSKVPNINGAQFRRITLSYQTRTHTIAYTGTGYASGRPVQNCSQDSDDKMVIAKERGAERGRGVWG